MPIFANPTSVHVAQKSMPEEFTHSHVKAVAADPLNITASTTWFDVINGEHSRNQGAVGSSQVRWKATRQAYIDSLEERQMRNLKRRCHRHTGIVLSASDIRVVRSGN